MTDPITHENTMAEIDRLKAEVAHLTSDAGPDSCAAIVAENDRLRAALATAERERDEAREHFDIHCRDENEMCDGLNAVLDKRGGYTEAGGDTYAANFERLLSERESRLATAEGLLRRLVEWWKENPREQMAEIIADACKLLEDSQ